MTIDDLDAGLLAERREQAARTLDEARRDPRPLDMSRGKPSPEQLDLSNPLLGLVGPDDYRAADGTDCRNYGGLEGIAEARELLGSVLGVPAARTIVGGNSSLRLMYSALALAWAHGTVDGTGPWRDQQPRWLCPVPGYDRHFTICQELGIEMIPVDVTDEGVDIHRVESLVADDARIKGMWIVPKHANPTGVTITAEVTRRLATMATAATDFRVFWDNAYAVHDLTDDQPLVADPFAPAEAAGHENRFLGFTSTSKMTFAGAGISALTGSEASTTWLRRHFSVTTIGPDKLNQLRHARFFGDLAGIRRHMARHAEILRPKFALVDQVLAEELGGTGLARWSSPEGGYFISLDVPEGCARRAVALAAEVGLTLTPAGATYPGGRDPHDANLRIAPTFPSLDEVERAMRVLAACVIVAAAERATASGTR
jgi:DNA-binding transcriptional MocR family regulator